MMSFMKRCCTRLSVLAISIFIASCSVTDSNKKREVSDSTLASLVKESVVSQQANTDMLADTIKVRLLTRQQRTDKLEKIYRSILTLEPNKQVRAQIQHRMVQLDIEKHEQSETLENKAVLEQLIQQYRGLLSTFPTRSENEEIQYELAKTYDLLGKGKASILTIESLLKNYPNTKHYAELQFRRGELYYNLQQYPLALKAYQAVITADNNEYYRLNSVYMSGWSLFKLNRLPEADDKFFAVLSQIAKLNYRNTVAARESLTNLGFDHVSTSHKSLAMDTQRVLSISLSQQRQAKSLVALVKRQQSMPKVTATFEHILFKNLADFLLEKGLAHDAILTYQAYMNYAPHSHWAANFSLALIELHQQKNQLSKVKAIQERFVDYYGLTSRFWQQANQNDKAYVLPHLLAFSLAKSQRLYAYAQELEDEKARVSAFGVTGLWLKKYLDIVEYSNSQKMREGVKIIDNANLATQEYFLYAEANFEAHQYKKALNTYKMLAYSPVYINQKEINTKDNVESLTLDDLPMVYIRKESAYAAIVTIKALITPFTLPLKKGSLVNDAHQKLQVERQQLTDLFLEYYGDDRRATLIAVKAAEYAFEQNSIDDVIRYSDFVMNAYKVTTSEKEQITNELPDKNAPVLTKQSPIHQLQQSTLAKLDNIALKQLAIVSQLKANIRYKFKHYDQAEQDYLLALNFVNDKEKKATLNELVASSIYEQAKASQLLATESANELAVTHYLRLGKLVPNSTYRANAEFDAANLLLAGQHWSRAIRVLKQFQQQFPLHQYTSTIPAKLALSYENLADWSQAAQQLLVMVANEKDIELKRESQYTAAEYFLKAGDLANAVINFRTYAHQYPEPFAVAQEVRFKMSEFYRETKEPNKRYFWYRKLIHFHQKQQKISSANLARSRYLASYAAFNLGHAHQQTFNQTKLKVPLNKSLKQKQVAMKQAIHYYQLVFQWQLAEFVPQANYSIGQIYRNLAEDVMQSERPKNLDELALEEYEFVLEEIAYPFEEKAIEIHQANAERAWDNIYDQWVKESLAVLAEMEPAKYNKYETVPEVYDDIF
jgi:tetratricopeptide (TPR) repeat protein